MKAFIGVFFLLVIVCAIFGVGSHSSTDAPATPVVTSTHHRAPAATIDDCWSEMIDASNLEARGLSYDGPGCTDEAMRQLSDGTG